MDKSQLLSLKCQLSHAKIVSGAYKYEEHKIPKKYDPEAWTDETHRPATDEEKLKIEIKKMTDCIKEMESLMQLESSQDDKFKTQSALGGM